jgi:hypothetical protein
MIGMDWIHLAYERDQERPLVNAVINKHTGYINCKKFLAINELFDIISLVFISVVYFPLWS